MTVAKIEKFGARFVSHINSFCKSKGLDFDVSVSWLY